MADRMHGERGKFNRGLLRSLMCVFAMMAMVGVGVMPDNVWAKSNKKSAKAAPHKASKAKVGKSKKSAAHASRGARTKVYVGKGRYRKVAYVAPAPRRLSIGEQSGLRLVNDELALGSSVALVIDQASGQTIFEKNTHAILPIASLTKLMTAVVTIESGANLDEVIEITPEEIDTEKGTRSRLSIGTAMTRREALKLALMSSENRAAHALGRSYPGGTARFVSAMNAQARLLGMNDTNFVDPTGLSSRNVSSAVDLAKLVAAAHKHFLIRSYSTEVEHSIWVHDRAQLYRNTNKLVLEPDWQIGLSKTGFISEAGKCLVMQARVQGRPVIMVLLDSTGRYTRIEDAQRIKAWLEQPRT